jgi:hypothetical protein
MSRWNLGMLVLLGILGSLAIYNYAEAAPKAGSQEECVAFADLALTHRALVVGGVEDGQRSKVIAEMYLFPTIPAMALSDAIRKAAEKSDLSARDFANKLGDTCIKGRGNMDSMLGSDV